jgi:hypothetical protein
VGRRLSPRRIDALKGRGLVRDNDDAELASRLGPMRPFPRSRSATKAPAPIPIRSSLAHDCGDRLVLAPPEAAKVGADPS